MFVKRADDKAFVKSYRENEENSQSTEVSAEDKARFERLVHKDEMTTLKRADDKAFVKSYRENEENSQSTEVSAEDKARFERLVRKGEMKNLRECEKYADDKAFVERYRENEENSQSTEVSAEDKARFERLVHKDEKKNLRKREKYADDKSYREKRLGRVNEKRRAISEVKRQAREKCKDESSKRRRIITDADAMQNITPIRREDARLNHPLILLLNQKKTSRNLYDLIMNDEMLCALQQYFVEHRDIKPSRKFLKSAQGCMNVSHKLIRKCIDNIPGLKEICNSISFNTPLRKGSSETAQAIIIKYFPEIVR